MLELTIADADAIARQAEQNGETVVEVRQFETYINTPSQLGRGSSKSYLLRNGLCLEVIRFYLWEPVRLRREHTSKFPLTAKLFLSGVSKVETLNAPEISREYYEVTGDSYLYHLPELAEVEEYAAGQDYHYVNVFADPEYFQSFNYGQASQLDALQKLLNGDRTQRFHQSLGAMQPQTNQILQQILSCPYQGMMQQLFLEAKALELLALNFATLAEKQPSLASTNVNARDVEPLHLAKDILINQAKTPPSLMELARLVGLNDRKLERGFRQLFGTTVFGYLRDYRLQQAQQLLQQPEIKVAQVANAVGYRNPEAFSTAFRRKFSISPKAYQMSRRG